MHTTLVRGQNVFGFFTTVAFFVAALIALSDFAHPRTPEASIVVKDIQVYVCRALQSQEAILSALFSPSKLLHSLSDRLLHQTS